MKRMFVGQRIVLEECLPHILYGYRRCRLYAVDLPFELIFGAKSRISPSEPVALIANASDAHFDLELLASFAFHPQRRGEQVSRICD